MVSVVPSVSTQGWLMTVGERADRLLAYFFSSEYSQSKTFYGSVSSLPYLISINQSKMNSLQSDIESELIRLMSPYFDQIDFIVRVEAKDDSNTEYIISISAKIIHDDMAYEFGKAIKINDSIITKISNLEHL